MAVKSPVASARSQAVSEIAQSGGMREALRWLTREKQWITDMQIQLCRIPAPTFLEHERAAWMLNQFRELGCTAHIDQVGNVIAAPDRVADNLPIIAITAHP